MDFMLCSLAFVICLALQVSSQLPPKRIGEWHPDRHTMYPNPWVDSSACNTPETSGLCDFNEILTPEQRKYFIEQPEMKKVSNGDRRCLCNKDCGAQIRIIVTVAIMKKIGPQITDYRAASKDFAEKFRTAWRLNDCSVILIASKGDNMCFLDAGSDVNDLLTAGLTEQIDRKINEEYCSKGLFVLGINTVLNEYRNALAVAAQTPAPTPESETRTCSFTAATISVTVSFLLLVILLIICFFIPACPAYKYCHSKDKIREDQTLKENPDNYSHVNQVEQESAYSILGADRDANEYQSLELKQKAKPEKESRP